MALPAVLLDSALCLLCILFFFQQRDNEAVRTLHGEENSYGVTDAGTPPVITARLLESLPVA